MAGRGWLTCSAPGNTLLLLWLEGGCGLGLAACDASCSPGGTHRPCASTVPPKTATHPHLATALPPLLCALPPPTPPTLGPRTTPQEHGRIDVSDPRNSSAAYPSSAFSPVQVALARLEAMADVKPACYSQYRALYGARSTQSR